MYKNEVVEPRGPVSASRRRPQDRTVHMAHHTRNGIVAPDSSMARVPRHSSLVPRSSFLVPRFSIPPSLGPRWLPLRAAQNDGRGQRCQQGRVPRCRSLHAGRADSRAWRGDTPGVQQQRLGGIGTGREHSWPPRPALPATAHARAAHPAKSIPHRGLGGLVRRSRSSCFRCPAENAVGGR